VAAFAGVVGVTASHLDGDDVDWAVVVQAAGLVVQMDAVDCRNFTGLQRHVLIRTRAGVACDCTVK